MDKNRRVLAGLLAVAFFMLIIIYLPKSFEEGIPAICIDEGTCQHEVYLESIISYLPAIIVLGFILGVAASYFYFERKIELPVPAVDRNKVLLSLLQPSERKVITKILESNGEALQSDISRIEGLGKVKAHRVIEKLVRRGVLEKEQKGKTNVLKLRKDLMEAMKS